MALELRTDACDADEALMRQLRAIDGVDPDAGLAAVGGRLAMYRRLLGIFTQLHADDASAIAAELAAGHAEAARAAAHRLRGSAATLGLVALESAAASLEHGEAGAAERLSTALAAMLQALQAALAA